MSMTMRGHRNLGGQDAVISPFMDNGKKQRVSISVDNAYKRGKIPAFSLWAPSDKGSNPWKYMPYMPAVTIRTATNTSSLDIDNRCVDYLRAGDEIIVLDVSELSGGNLAFRGNSGEDLSAVTLGTDSSTVASIGAKDSGAGGTGFVLVTLTDALNAAATGGAEGTGDIIVLCGSSTSIAIKSYQEADTIVIMEQAFNFQAAVDGGAIGQGGYLQESCVYSYTGRVDSNYVNFYDSLNDADASPALTIAGKFTNYSRFNFESIYRG